MMQLLIYSNAVFGEDGSTGDEDLAAKFKSLPESFKRTLSKQDKQAAEFYLSAIDPNQNKKKVNLF